MRRVFRRRLMLPLALFAVAAVSTGCGTFADSDSVARVGEVSLSQDDFEATLTEVGASQRSRSTPNWCAAEITDAGSASTSPTSRSTRTRSAATATTPASTTERRAVPVGDRRGGRGHRRRRSRPSSTEVARSTRPSPSRTSIRPQAATGGNLDCVPRDVVDAAAEQPFIQASVVARCRRPGRDGAAVRTPTGDEARVGRGRLPSVRRPHRRGHRRSWPPDTGSTADVYVDPRYGTFDSTTGQVIGLG